MSLSRHRSICVTHASFRRVGFRKKASIPALWLIVGIGSACSPENQPPTEPSTPAQQPSAPHSDAPAPTIDQEVQISAAILPHCLYGIDPHARGVHVNNGDDPTALTVRPQGLHALRLAGLMERDRVRTVNGFPLGTPEQWVEAWNGTRNVPTCIWEVTTTAKIPWTLKVHIQPAAPTTQPIRKIEGERYTVRRDWAVSQFASAYTRFTEPWTGFESDGDFRVRIRSKKYQAVFFPQSEEPETSGRTSRFRKFLRIHEPHPPSDAGVEAFLHSFLDASSVQFTVFLDGTPVTRTYDLEGPPITWPIVRPDENPPTENPNPNSVHTVPLGTPLGESIRVRVHRNAEGEPDGVRLSGVRRHSLAASWGLRSGDIITHIDTHPVDSKASFSERTKVLSQPGAHTLQLIRRGEPETLEVDAKP
jgi:hypothetical protein